MEISLGKLAFDLDFHPSEQLVTAGLIDGDLHLYRYSSGSVPERSKFIKRKIICDAPFSH